MIGAMEMDELIDQVMQATWSLEEAAHLVHAVNPVTQPVKLSDRSKDPVARTFFWLKKEYEKDRLFSIAGDEQTPRFIPGTLMRHMEDKGRFISKVVRNMYDVAHGHPGLKGLDPSEKPIYLEAAKLIWKDHPDFPAAHVAHILTELPTKFTKHQLLRYTPGTLRKWLRGKGPGKVGRPSSKKKALEKPDISKLAAKLGGN